MAARQRLKVLSINNKSLIRKQILNKRKSLEESFVASASRDILDRLFALKEYREANLILTYADHKGEVETSALIRDALKKGKKVACPKVSGKEMDFFLIGSLDDLKRGYMGIPEPDTLEKVSAKDQLMIMPGLAFDEKCHRIGYGGGFYDRFLSKYPGHCDKIALAFEFQIFYDLPYDEFDICPDMVITEKRVIRNTGHSGTSKSSLGCT